MLDVGQPLDADRDVVTPLPGVAGFQSADPSLLGIPISHGHQDHWGLIGEVSSHVPVFMGEPSRCHHFVGSDEMINRQSNPSVTLAVED